ncbi:MAG: DMT family transporter [Elusimicrobiales bacterium]|nr:DMT family transporter [Elusimicrobiales bacterium]
MNITPLGAIWLNVCINSFIPILGFLAAGRISPPLFALAGSGIGFACFIPWAVRNKAFALYFRRDLWPRLLAIGFFGSALPIAALVMALNYTTPANAAILGQVEAVYTVILSRLFLREKICGSQLFGTGLVLAGTMLIAFKERFTMRWTGDLIVLAVPLMYQISHLFSKKLPKDLSHVFVASARTLFATLGILPVFLLGFFMPVAQFEPTLRVVSIVLAWGVVLTAFNNILWYKAILNMDLSKATAIVLCYPVLTAILSHVLGIEKIQGYQVLGLCLALAGAYWVTRLVRRQGGGQVPAEPAKAG